MADEHDLELDMRKSTLILEKVKSDVYAQNLYAAMCNMQWQKTEVFPILRNDLWSASWRSSGGIVAELRGGGDYMDWYCSGIGGMNYDTANANNFPGYVSEGRVTDEIRADLGSLGWHPVPWDDDKG